MAGSSLCLGTSATETHAGNTMRIQNEAPASIGHTDDTCNLPFQASRWGEGSGGSPGQ